MSGTLNTFLDPEDEREPEAPPPVEPAPPEPVAEAPEPVTEPEVADPEEKPVPAHLSGYVPYAKAKAEKERRLEAERQLAELRAQMAAPRAPEPAPPRNDQPPADWNPTGNELALHLQFNQSKLLAIREMGGRDKVTALEAEFQTLADKNPVLRSELLRQEDPYAWIKDVVEQNNPDLQRSKLEAKIRAELEAEYAGRVAPAEPASPRFVGRPSIATSPSVQKSSVPIEVDDSLETMFKKKGR